MTDEETHAPSPTEDPQTTDDLLRAILDEQRAQRAVIQDMQDDLDKARKPLPRQSSIVLSPEELHEARMLEVGQHDFYCPGCGALYDRARECSGRGEAPHPPMEVVSTDELKAGDPSKHTEAPGVNP